MGLITTVALATCAFGGTIFVAAMSRMLADDLRDWAPKLIEWLINRAVAMLPQDGRERLAEEWRSHVNEIPGTIGKVAVAIGYSRAATALARTPRSEVTAITTDILANRLAQIVMSISEQHLDCELERLQPGIVVVSTDSRERLVNDAARKLLDYVIGDAAALRHTVRVFDEDPDEFKSAINHFMTKMVRDLLTHEIEG